MSLILSVETGTNICSVALSKDGVLLSLLESEEGRNHAGNLAVFIREILVENKISTEDLDAVAVGMGPGSYTGLRIGVSVVKGICYASKLPLIAVNSLRSLCYVAKEDFNAGVLDIDSLDNAIMCPMIDARRMEVYSQLFDSDVNVISKVESLIINEDSFAEYKECDNFVIFGNGAKKCVDVIALKNLSYCNVVPSARGMVSLAHEAFIQKDFEDLAYFEPFYLKDFVAGVSKKNLLHKG